MIVGILEREFKINHGNFMTVVSLDILYRLPRQLQTVGIPTVGEWGIDVAHVDVARVSHIYDR